MISRRRIIIKPMKPFNKIFKSGTPYLFLIESNVMLAAEDPAPALMKRVNSPGKSLDDKGKHSLEECFAEVYWIIPLG